MINKKNNLKKRTYKGMLGLKTIFEERTNVLLGLTRDEIIHFYYSIPINKIIKLNDKIIQSKWSEIKTVKKYLLWRDNFPIIYKNMPKGTELFDNILGKRILMKRTNVFFKCINLMDAHNWRNDYDKMAKSIYRTGSRPSEIIEEEQFQIPITQIIKNGIKSGIKNET